MTIFLDQDDRAAFRVLTRFLRNPEDRGGSEDGKTPTGDDGERSGARGLGAALIGALAVSAVVAAATWLLLDGGRRDGDRNDAAPRTVIWASVRPGLERPAAIRDLRRNWSARQIDCLARNIYWEAAFESEHGRRLVAHITMNRVADARFPNTICGVVMQPYAFSWTISSTRNASFRGRAARPPANARWTAALRIAREVAERRYWWDTVARLDRGLRTTRARWRATESTGDLLTALRQRRWLVEAGYARGDFPTETPLRKRFLRRRDVAGLLWYLNTDLVSEKVLRRWRQRLIPVMRVGGHLFFTDQRGRRGHTL